MGNIEEHAIYSSLVGGTFFRLLSSIVEFRPHLKVAQPIRLDFALTAVCFCFRLSYLFSYIRIVSYGEFKKATESDLVPMRIFEGTMGMMFLVLRGYSLIPKIPGFMFETSMMLTITDYATLRSGKLHGKSSWGDSVNQLIHSFLRARTQDVGRLESTVHGASGRGQS